MTALSSQQLDGTPALDDRARAVADRTRTLLERDAVPVDRSEPDALEDALAQASAALHAELTAPGAGADTERAAGRCEALAELTALQRELREYAIEQRFRSLARIHEALARLRDRSGVAALLEAAAVELSDSCDFDRTVISRVHGTSWTCEVIHMRPGQDPEIERATRAFLTGEPLPLHPHMLETQLIRRRAAAVITDPAGDASIHQPLVVASHTPGYVAAPIMPTGRVIGFLHADCQRTGRDLSALDRDNLWTFAEGFGLIFERMVLFERLVEQRTQAREAFAVAERQLDELCDAEVELARRERPSGTAATNAAAMFARPTSRVDTLLSAREREVMELMVTGARNGEIAARLVIAEETVKSHVKKIRQKLRAANRADAVSRYLQMTMREGGQSPRGDSLGSSPVASSRPRRGPA